MEDLNMIAADCIVISCCCEFLVLQIVIFVLIKIPLKMIRKTKAYAKKRIICGRRRRLLKGSWGCVDEAKEVVPLREQVEGFLKDIGAHGYGDDGGFCCIEEAEKVLEDLSQKGLFGFGSFWGTSESGEASTCRD